MALGKFGVEWLHGHSAYVKVPSDGVVHFMCFDCGADLDKTSHLEHCWDCMAKFCNECWGFHGYTHDDRHHKPKLTLEYREIMSLSEKELQGIL